LTNSPKGNEKQEVFQQIYLQEKDKLKRGRVKQEIFALIHIHTLKGINILRKGINTLRKGIKEKARLNQKP